MQKFYLLILSVLFCCAALLSGCSMNETTPIVEYVNIDGKDVPSSVYEQDIVRVKFSPEMMEQLEIGTDSDGNVTTKVQSMNNAIASLNIVSMERTFPYAGKFEERTRREGLHLWYDVVFAPETGLTKAGESLNEIEGIDIVEYRPKAIRYSGKVTHYASNPKRLSESGNQIFNDPYLYERQWHYYNDGSFNPSIAGSDINVLPVWEKYTKGNKDVIVSVVDGGIDWEHEDLADNMWHNPEQTGDKVYGYNFVRRSYNITSDEHGTHVAGTIAAVNNNGIGVCGIAGGDKAAGIEGVRLMSCQIFEGKNGANGAPAIKWGADHGAVISQNSWGYDLRYVSKTPDSDKEAIDYFNKYAGLDENGNQTGPIAGGVVIVAAGNDSRNIGFPGDYEGCVAVAAISSDYTAAYYTNYGPWVDVSAPGGDAQKQAQIYSTLPGNKYGEMQGTSMACPHVSGIAALIASKNAGTGYTGAQLKQALLESVVDISKYSGSIQIGKGLVNTYNAVVGKSSSAPEAIKDFSATTVTADRITFSLTVPKDSDDGKPYHIFIYAYDSEINKDNYTKADAWSVLVGDTNAGEKLTGEFHVDQFNSSLYLSAVAVDASGLHSAFSKNVQITTGTNTPPTVTPLDGTSVTLNAYEAQTLRFLAIDPDKHKLTASISPRSNIVSSRISNDTVYVTFDPKNGKPGTLDISLKVSDPYSSAQPIKITYTIDEDKSPILIKDLPVFSFKSVNAAAITIDGNEYFADPDNSPITYKAICNSGDIAEVTIEDNLISVTPIGLGSTGITIIATDFGGKRIQATSTITVAQASNLINAYPNPVTDIVKIQILESATLSKLSVRSNSGKYVLNQTDITVSPSAPIEVDMTEYPAGIYIVTAEFEDGRIYKSSISKI